MSVPVAMKAVFRDRFAEFVRTFIHSKRERDEYELSDRAACHRERGFQRRLASLERGQDEFDSFVEEASLQIEHLHAQLSAMMVEREGGVHEEQVVCDADVKERPPNEKNCLDQRVKRRIDEWVEI
jgi:hypothetical protein